MMMKRLALSLMLMLVLSALPASAQEAPPPAPASAPAPAPAPKPATVLVTMVTSLGPVVIELEKQRAPITTNNFLRYVDARRFDNTSFYRAVNVPGMPELGLVQGGVKFDPRIMFPAIAHEPTSKTGVLHTDGTISMGRNAPGTAAGDFFITIGKMDYMNADPAVAGDAGAGYAAFGHVVEGMDVLKKVLAAPRSPTLGEGVMKGQMLAPTVKIISVRRANLAPKPK